MRNNYIQITIIALVAGIAATLIVACNKTNDDVISISGIVQKFTPTKDAVPDLLTMFTQTHQDYKAGIKSGGESMDLGEAIWTLEGGVNYEYRGDKSELRYTALDTLLLTADVFIDESQVYQIYTEDVYAVYDEMLRFAATLVNEENILLFASLDVISTHQTYVELKYTVVLGFGGINQSGMNETDYWYAAGGLGKCGPYIGQQIGKDATDRIRFFLNAVQVNVDYWTDVDVFWHIYEGLIACPNNESCFWGPGSQWECLEPSEMTDWLNKAFFVVDYLKPIGKQRIEAYFTSDAIVGYDYWVHCFEFISYGIPHSTPPQD